MVKFIVEASQNLKDCTVRAGVISDGGIIAQTPIRVLNSTELAHGDKINSSGLSVPRFPHKVFEITRFMKPQRVMDFIKNPEVSATITKNVRKISESAGNRIILFHPVLRKDMEISDEINEKLIELQIHCEHEVTTILDSYNSPVSSFKKRLKESIKQIKNSGNYSEPMPSIRMDMDNKLFNEKIDTCIENNIRAINLTYANIRDHFQNFMSLVKLARNKSTRSVWMHMSETPRKILRQTSVSHLLPLVSIDSYALNSKPLPLGIIQRKEVIIKRFDSHTLGFLTPEEHIKIHGNTPACNCFVENRNKLTDTLSVYQAADLLSSAMQCHETNSSFYELNRSRRAIFNHKYDEYLRTKSHINMPLKRLLKIDLAQGELP